VRRSDTLVVRETSQRDAKEHWGKERKWRESDFFAATELSILGASASVLSDEIDLAAA
jgi:hypothetical protein